MLNLYFVIPAVSSEFFSSGNQNPNFYSTLIMTTFPFHDLLPLLPDPTLPAIYKIIDQITINTTICLFVIFTYFSAETCTLQVKILDRRIALALQARLAQYGFLLRSELTSTNAIREYTIILIYKPS